MAPGLSEEFTEQDEELVEVVAVYTCVFTTLVAMVFVFVGALGGVIFLIKGRKA